MKLGKYCLFALVLLLISQLYSFSSATWDIDEKGIYSMSGVTNYITEGLKYISLFIMLRLATKNISYKIIFNEYRASFSFVVLFVFFWFVYSVITVSSVVDFLYSPVNPLVYLTILVMFLGGNDECWNALKKYSIYFAVVYLLLATISLSDVRIILNERISGNSPITKYFVSGFWCLAFSLIDVSEKKMTRKLFLLVLILLYASLAFSMTYRAWTIQCFLLLIILLLQLGKNKMTKFLLPIFFVAIAIGVVMNFLSSKSGQDSLLKLENKNQTDTRSFQYEEMFTQVPLTTWIFGGGFDATYKSRNGDNYKYIDNQILFTIFHYGIFMSFAYFYVWFSVWWKWFKSRRYEKKDKSASYVIMLWLFALGGLSVFHAIQINIQTILISLVLGRCVYSFKTKQLTTCEEI